MPTCDRLAPRPRGAEVAARRRRDEAGVLQVPIAGVTFLAVVLLIAVMGLLMGQAAETWESLVRHDLELELIARGEEIKAGIEEYQKEHGGKLPVKLCEDLCPKEKDNKRYIRRCWKDPMTGKDFRLIGPGEIGKRQREKEEKALQAGTDKLLGGFGKEGESGERNRGGLGLRDSGPAHSDIKFSMPGHESKQQLSGDQPFQGVASNSGEIAFKPYKNLPTYDLWEFIADNYNPYQQPRTPAGAGPGTATPGPGLTPIPGGGLGSGSATPFGGRFPRGSGQFPPPGFPTPPPMGGGTASPRGR